MRLTDLLFLIEDGEPLAIKIPSTGHIWQGFSDEVTEELPILLKMKVSQIFRSTLYNAIFIELEKEI